jgi:hypothetical protein
MFYGSAGNGELNLRIQRIQHVFVLHMFLLFGGFFCLLSKNTW